MVEKQRCVHPLQLVICDGPSNRRNQLTAARGRRGEGNAGASQREAEQPRADCYRAVESGVGRFRATLSGQHEGIGTGTAISRGDQPRRT
jgi:hypothetical protein